MSTAHVAVVTSHPIQYQAPWFRALAKHTDLEVFFCHRQDAAGQAAAGFGVEFEWDVPLLDGYKFTWLTNQATQPDVSTFGGCDTPEIADRLRDGQFDACIVSGWYLKSYMQAIRACRHSGIKVLSRGDSQLGTARSALWTIAKYLPYRWLLGSMDAHLYVGQANREYLKHYGVSDSRLFFTPHFVDNDFFAERAVAARSRHEPDSIRRSLGLSTGSTVFAFAGKLIEKKRPLDFIRALSVARKHGLDAQGLIIGSGPLEQDARALVERLGVPVGFAGFRNQSELPAYFAAADALVLPSDAGETWGLVVNEAMACGLPACVSTSAGCSRDLIDEGHTGYLFPVGDLSLLCEAMERLTATLSKERVAVEQAVRRRISQYSCDAAVEGTLAALERIQ